MDDRLNAAANVCLDSVCVRTICRNGRRRVAVRRCGRVRVWLGDALARTICRILRTRMGALLVCRRWPFRVLRRLGFLPSDLFLELLVGRVK